MVSTGYLATMGIELVAGRNFTDGTPYDQVIVNELYWTDDPARKNCLLGSPMTVIGVIRIPNQSVNAEVPPGYRRCRQNFDNLVLSIRLREMDNRSIGPSKPNSNKRRKSGSNSRFRRATDRGTPAERAFHQHGNDRLAGDADYR